MIELEIDGKKVQAAEGSMIIQAAFANGLYIPHFCYHRKLSIAANCRMCLVDVEKMPKPMPACALPVAQGMVVRTHSEKAIRPLLSMEEMTRCIHCTRCIRFGIEIGGVMELGLFNRAANTEITTVVG